GRPDYKAWASGQMPSPPEGESSKDFTARIVLALKEIVRDMMARECYESAVIMHGGAIMMLLAACALPQNPPAFWTSENGKGYTVFDGYGSTGKMNMIFVVLSRKEAPKVLKEIRRVCDNHVFVAVSDVSKYTGGYGMVN
ncbi:MAG: DUF2179 domain-containing protein, partial [Clostridia bacterium]|nr:DUF2179 domain-containing protein [Clostridia bacterium]